MQKANENKETKKVTIAFNPNGMSLVDCMKNIILQKKLLNKV